MKYNAHKYNLRVSCQSDYYIKYIKYQIFRPK